MTIFIRNYFIVFYITLYYFIYYITFYLFCNFICNFISLQSYLTRIIRFSELKCSFATVKCHPVGVFPCFVTTFLQLAYFLLRPRHSVAMAEEDYPEILLAREQGDHAGYSKCGGNVSPTRRAKDEWSTEYQTLSKKAHTKGLFFSRWYERAVRSYQTPSSRVDGGPFSCLIYSDKSFRGNGL